MGASLAAAEEEEVAAAGNLPRFSVLNFESMSIFFSDDSLALKKDTDELIKTLGRIV